MTDDPESPYRDAFPSDVQAIWDDIGSGRVAPLDSEGHLVADLQDAYYVLHPDWPLQWVVDGGSEGVADTHPRVSLSYVVNIFDGALGAPPESIFPDTGPYLVVQPNDTDRGVPTPRAFHRTEDPHWDPREATPPPALCEWCGVISDSTDGLPPATGEFRYLCPECGDPTVGDVLAIGRRM